MVWPLLLLGVARFGPAGRRRRRLFWCFGTVGVLSLLLSIWLTTVNQPWAFSARRRAPGSLRPALSFRFGDRTDGAHGRARQCLWGSLERCSHPRYRRAVHGPNRLSRLCRRAAGTRRRPCHRGRSPVADDWDRPAAPDQRVAFRGRSLLLALPMALAHPRPDRRRVPRRRMVVDSGRARFDPVSRLADLCSGRKSGPLQSTARRKRYASIALAALLTSSAVGLAMTARTTAKAALAVAPYNRYLAASEGIPSIYRNRCHADVFVVDPPACAFGNDDAAVTVVLFGNSHAAQWYPALHKMAKREGWRLISLTKSGCPSMAYTVFLTMLERNYTECDEWRDRAFAKIGEIRPTVTIIANSFRYAVRRSGEVDADGWRQATGRTLAALAGQSAATVIFKDTPWLPFNAPICLSRAAWRRYGPRPGLRIRSGPTSHRFRVRDRIPLRAAMQLRRS